MGKIKKFEEFIENVNERYSVEDNLHRLDEMAKISRDFDQLPKMQKSGYMEKMMNKEQKHHTFILK